ncbi:MAG: sensor domain-containing diguanylate cyclase [Propionivibrio sp.]
MTTLLTLDIRTVILLLFFGNLIAVAVFTAYRRDHFAERPYRLFLAGKLLQASAWALLALRGNIEDLASADVGNALLFTGFALETLAFAAATERASRRLVSAVALLTLIGCIVFWTLGSTASIRVAIASMVSAALLGTMVGFLLRIPDTSHLQLRIAGFYALLCVFLVGRTGAALFSPEGLGLFTASAIQILTFLTLFLLLIVGGIGFPLLLNERKDRLLREAHQELLSSEALLKNIFDTLTIAIFLGNGAGLITHANRRMGEMFGCDPALLVGSRYVDRIDPADREIAEQRIAAILRDELPLLRLERPYLRIDGSWFWGQLECTRIHDARAGEYLLLAVIADINELKLAEKHIREMAQHDSLTGLANRVLFSDRLRQATAAAQRDGHLLALLFIDLDRFKPINDNFGHAVGDQLLAAIARRIEGAVRESDTAARIGGDEFVVLLRSVEDGDGALIGAEKIRKAISRPYVIDGHAVSVSCSIGIALYPQHGDDEITLTKSADDAMYKVKEEGRDAIRMADCGTEPASAGSMTESPTRR